MPKKLRALALAAPALTATLGAQDFANLANLSLAPYLQVDWRAAATGDLDGDGDLDVAIACFGDPGQGQRNFWLRNDGSGWFERMPDAALQLAPSLSRDVVVADFDGDGDLDAFFANQRYDAICRNDGTGVLALAASDLPPIDRDSYGAQAADLDGDGDLDLIVACGGFDTLYLNDGTGTFTDGTANLPAAYDLTYDIDVGDYDGDGDLDLLRINPATWSELLVNDGTGVFSVATASLPSATTAQGGDLDGDGDRDFVLNTFASTYGGTFWGTTWYSNDGNGNFTQQSLPAINAFGPRETGLVDLDGDGDLDLAFRDQGLFQNDGAGNFTFQADRQLGVHFADIDDDGDLDQVGFPTRRNDGTGTLATATPVADVTAPWVRALTDVDNDGAPDLVVRDVTGTRVLTNSGRGTFPTTIAQMPNTTTTSLEPWLVGDWNSDGYVDLIAPAGNTLWTNNGGAGFSGTQLPISMIRAQTCDLDGDGLLDLAGYQTNNQAPFWMRNVNGTFIGPTSAPTLWSGTFECSADFDGDGRDEILMSVWGGSPEIVGVDSGTALAVVNGVLPAGLPEVVAATAADLDGDGDQDLILGHDYVFLPSIVTVLENDGAGNFQVAASPLPPTWFSEVQTIVAFDADRDGDLDLAVKPRYQQVPRTRLLRNDGGMSFFDATGDGEPWQGLVVPPGFGLFAGDVDRDGDVDLVADVDSLNTPELVVLSNLQRQIVRNDDPAIGNTWRLRVLQRPVEGSFGAVVVGLAELAAGTPTPFGTLRIDPIGASLHGPAWIDTTGPVEVFSVAVPNVPALQGSSVFAQHIVIDESGIELAGTVEATVR